MGRLTMSTTYVQPITMTTGALVNAAPGADANINGLGVYTLAANTTYFFMMAGPDASIVSGHLVFDATIAFSAKVEDCNFPPDKVKDYDDGSTGTTAGFWVDEDPSAAFVGTVGAGNTVSNGVLAHTAGAQGGALWHVSDTGARRSRIRVEVGATPGEVMFATWAKE